jgi:hypothetical protein
MIDRKNKHLLENRRAIQPPAAVAVWAAVFVTLDATETALFKVFVVKNPPKEDTPLEVLLAPSSSSPSFSAPSTAAEEAEDDEEEEDKVVVTDKNDLFCKSSSLVGKNSCTAESIKLKYKFSRFAKLDSNFSSDSFIRANTRSYACFVYHINQVIIVKRKKEI